MAPPVPLRPHPPPSISSLAPVTDKLETELSSSVDEDKLGILLRFVEKPNNLPSILRVVADVERILASVESRLSSILKISDVPSDVVTPHHHDKEIHSFALKSGHLRDIFFNNSLDLIYSECTTIKDVSALFGEMPHRDIVSRSTTIFCYNQHWRFPDAEALIRQMLYLDLNPGEIAPPNMLNLYY